MLGVVGTTLRALAPSIDAGLKKRAAEQARTATGRTSLVDELRAAAAAPGLAARPRWQALAEESELLLDGPAYRDTVGPKAAEY